MISLPCIRDNHRQKRQIDEDVSEAMSLMKMRKSRGPSTVPCGTLNITGVSLKVYLSITTLWFMHDRIDSTHPMISLLKLCCLRFCKRRWCGTLLKSLAKSSTATSAWECRFSIYARSWVVMISWDSQDRHRLKSCCMFTKMLWLSRCLIVYEPMMLSVILQQMDVRDTGQ